MLVAIKFAAVGLMVLAPGSLAIGILKKVGRLRVAMNIFTWLTGTESDLLPGLLLFLCGTQMYASEILLIVFMALTAFIGSNFLAQWLRIQAKEEWTCVDSQTRRKAQILYRGHQVFCAFLRDWCGLLVPLVVLVLSAISIAAFTVVIKFYRRIGPVYSACLLIVGVSCITAQGITIGMANRFVTASQAYIDRGLARAREARSLVDVKFFRSCQSIQWNVAMVPVTITLFVTIVDSVVVSWVVDLLLLF